MLKKCNTNYQINCLHLCCLNEMDKLVQQFQNFRIAYAETLVGQSGIFRTVKVLVPIECKHANAIFDLARMQK